MKSVQTTACAEREHKLNSGSGFRQVEQTDREGVKDGHIKKVEADRWESHTHTHTPVEGWPEMKKAKLVERDTKNGEIGQVNEKLQ